MDLSRAPKVMVHFSDYFGVSPRKLKEYGAFNVSLINDLPLFIDPFLLFNSANKEYRKLHADLIDYLRFLRKRATTGLDPGLVGAWYTFKEVKQTWLGFSERGNEGHGLGRDFARDLHSNLGTVFATFGAERVTTGSHLEKLCLIRRGVGRDSISDFTTNLIKSYLLAYTQRFAQEQIDPKKRRKVIVPRVQFNYNTESWEAGSYDLPWLDNDFVLLTPRDILTKDENWINRSDMIGDFSDILVAMPNAELRAQLNNYLVGVLPKEPSDKERREAIARTIEQFPEFIEYFIRYKEDHGDEAVASSEERVEEIRTLFVEQVSNFVGALESSTDFYSMRGGTPEETHARILFFKDVIENKGGHKIFYLNNEPITKETDLHIMFRLVWFATPSDVSREVNDGRGPADFKVSRGSRDKTIVEFKLASNKKLRRNLEKQTEIYQKASDATTGIKVIVYFTAQELAKVEAILQDLGLLVNPNVVLIDGRRDNKPSASAA
jgi:hypothetical protein